MNSVQGVGMTSQRTRTRMVARLREQGIRDERVLTAIGTVPRHMFVDAGLAHRAYEDTALPLGFGQTISQPYVVARMIELLIAGRSLGKTLEVGAGCGYQTCVLAMLTKDVYAMERIAPLLTKAKDNLRQLRLPQVRFKHGDGHLGIPEAKPFDTIILAAAASHVPPSLLDQLALSGRLIMPLATMSHGNEHQVLLLVEHREQGFVETRFDAVRFVPLLPGVE
jgi:protein-L-isoaspartate(D-aspartate) O-methyltransferase